LCHDTSGLIDIVTQHEAKKRQPPRRMEYQNKRRNRNTRTVGLFAVIALATPKQSASLTPPP
jgi:hypothetical protein